MRLGDNNAVSTPLTKEEFEAGLKTLELWLVERFEKLIDEAIERTILLSQRPRTTAQPTVCLLYEEVSDQDGTDRVVAVFSDMPKAEAAKERLRNRSLITQMVVNPEDFEANFRR